MEELEKNGKTAHAHVRSTNAIVKMITLLKAIHIIHSIPIQIYFSFSQTWKKNPKIHMKKPHNTIESENILEQKEKMLAVIHLHILKYIAKAQ